MLATEMFRKNHRTIRRALASLDRALLMQTTHWPTVARNLVNYLDMELREYWGSEERLVFRPLAETGPDAAGVVAEMEQEHRELEGRLAELKELTRGPICEATALLVREKGLGLAKEFLHHMFVEEEVGFTLAEARLGQARLEEVAAHVLLLQEAGKEMEEPVAVD